MNKLTPIIIASLFLVLSSSIFCSAGTKKLNKVIREFSKITEKKGFNVCGTGGGVDEGKIRKVCIRLTYDEVMDLETARTLIVDTATKFVCLANSDLKLKDYFIEHPITYRSLSLGIFGNDPVDLSTDYIGTAGLVLDEVFYTRRNPNPNILHSITVHEETFQEAVAIVKASQDSCSCQDAISLKTSDSSTGQNCSDTSELPEPALAIP